MSKILLIGFSDCEYCTKASEFLTRSGFEVTNYWSSKKRIFIKATSRQYSTYENDKEKL